MVASISWWMLVPGRHREQFIGPSGKAPGAVQRLRHGGELRSVYVRRPIEIRPGQCRDLTYSSMDAQVSATRSADLNAR